jgi:hypothetical protein
MIASTYFRYKLILGFDLIRVVYTLKYDSKILYSYIFF